jgi:type IV pilus biogenesis/stability protein PilW
VVSILLDDRFRVIEVCSSLPGGWKMVKMAKTETAGNFYNLFFLMSMVPLMLLGCVPYDFTGSDDGRKTSEVHYQVGINYLGEGKTPQAIKEFLSAQALSPKNPDIEHALGLAYQQKGLNDEAIEQYKKALYLDPKLTEARNNLGTVLLTKGLYDDAIAQFEFCMKDQSYTTPEKAAYNIGLAYYKKKEIDKSIEYYQKAVQLRADNVNAIYNLAYIFEEKKDFPRALEYYRKVVTMEPSFKEAHYRLGMLYEQQGELPKAMESFQKAVDIDQNYLVAHLRLGTILLKSGNPEKGLKSLELVAKGDPEGELGKRAVAELGRAPMRTGPRSKITGH